MAEAKLRRDADRNRHDADLAALTRESQWMKAELKRIRESHNAIIAGIEAELAATEGEIASLREERRRRSAQLQRLIFDHFVMLNARGETRTLTAADTTTFAMQFSGSQLILTDKEGKQSQYTRQK